jgi:hypothetical protein
MTKFKVGDMVVGNQGDELNDVEEGQLYTVLEVDELLDGCFLKVDNDKRCWVCSWRFDLYKAVPYQEAQDDPLPPAPESVRYYTVPSKTQYLDILTNEFGEVEIRSILPDFASYNYLTPDAALQLAHDLNRMANEIKRKETQQERKTTLSPAIVHLYGE